MTKNIRIENKELIKQGMGKRGAWTLTRITDQEGNAYTTFNGGLYNIGQECAITYEEETVQGRNGGTFTNRKIQDNPRTGATAYKTPTKTSDHLAALNRILEIVENIEKKVDNLAVLRVTPEKPKSAEEMPPEYPF